METTLQDLINAATGVGADATQEQRTDAVAQLLAERGADPEAFSNEALEKYRDLRENGDRNDETTAALVALADVIEGAAIHRRTLAEQDRARDEELAALDQRVAPEPDEDGTDGEDGDDENSENPDNGSETDGNRDKDVTERDNNGGAGDGTGKGENGGGDGDTPVTDPAAASTPEPVTAAAKRTQRAPRVDLGAVRRNSGTRPQPRKRAGAVITAAAGLPGVETGARMSMADLNKAVIDRMSRFPQHRIEPGTVMQASLASIRLPFEDPKLRAGGAIDDQAVLDYAGDPKRLEGNSLLAAGGWCSPSETFYELCPGLESATAGMIDVPDIRVTRGGIRTTEGPDIGAVFSGIGFKQTEAQAVAGDVKPNYRVPCPEFTDTRAGVMGINIISGILQNDSYPEMTRRVVELATVVHAHKMNMDTIAGIAAGSTDVGSLSLGPSAATRALNAVELQVMDYRYRYRADETLQLELKLPLFLKAVIRADLALRSGVQLETVTDQQINGHFNQRGVSVQWLYDWQDAFAGVVGGLGSATPITAWPTTVTGVLYAAGSWVRGRGEVINVEGVYDSTGLENNDFTRLFFEEKFLLKRRCYQSRRFTIPLAINGATGAPVELDATGNIVVPTP